VSGFTTQAQFLLESIAADPDLAQEAPTPAAASALKTLVLPGEMGERFKLIWLTRCMDPRGLPGRDFRSWLSDRRGV
jgi:SAM-dependent MidA family methyltransferase